MRIFKALAAVLAGILLLALPAVAAGGPRPGTPECAGERAEAKAEAEQNGEPVPPDPCTGSTHKCAPPEGADAVNAALGTTTCSLGADDAAGGLGGT